MATVRCFTCGCAFNKAPSKIKKRNFCSKDCLIVRGDANKGNITIRHGHVKLFSLRFKDKEELKRYLERFKDYTRVVLFDNI